MNKLGEYIYMGMGLVDKHRVCISVGYNLDYAIKKAEQLSNQGLQTLLVCFNNIPGLHLSNSIHNENLLAGNFHAIVQKLFQAQNITNVDLFYVILAQSYRNIFISASFFVFFGQKWKSHEVYSSFS